MARSIFGQVSEGETRKELSPGVILLPPLCFLGAMMIGADFAAILFAPLKALQIPYPRWLEYFHLIVPAACGLLWLVSLRWWPHAGSVVLVLVCFWLTGLIPPYAEGKVANVPIVKWIEPSQLDAIELRLSIRALQRGSGGGTFILVAPENEQKLRTEPVSLGLLVHASDK